MLFLHGGVGAWTPRPELNRFPGFRCLAPDLLGPDRTAGEFVSIPEVAARVADLIRDRAPSGRAHLVGLSFGGQVALQLLATEPDLVDRAVVSGVLTRPLPGQSAARETLIDAVALASFGLFVPFGGRRALVRATMRALDVAPELEPEFTENARRLGTDAIRQFLNATLSFRLPPGLSRFRRPVLVAAGGRERAVVLASARDIAAALPDSQGVVVPGTGQGWNREKPDLFSRTVCAWLTGTAMPPGLEPLAAFRSGTAGALGP